MSWKKLGNIFVPNQQHNWMHSHASLPSAHPLGNGVFRVFFSSRDLKGYSHIGFFDYDLSKMRIIHLNPEPILSPGPPNTFDHFGLSMGSTILINDQLYLYYVGWGQPINGRFNNTIGLAIWNEEENRFIKSQENPVLGIDRFDKLNMSYPFVMRNEDSYSMWYGSNISWGKGPNQMEHCLKKATSKNGIHWKKNKSIIIDLKESNEHAIVRPSVINGETTQKMWYAYKGESYRIGYAESSDTINWVRKDTQVGLDIGSDEWENEEVTYPHIFEYKNQLYMLYNGNNYGLSGIGLAIQY